MAKLKISVLIYWIIALGAIAFLTIGAAGVSQGAMTDCIDATCRITSPDGGVGTGCVFEISQGTVYVLTAAHVVEGGQSAQCEFWTTGHQSSPLSGQVIAKSTTVDAAIIAVPEVAFGGILPKVIPIAPRSRVIAPGETLTSVGCANGTWSTGWKGHALGYSGADLHFLPTPANGRSGSAVFDAEGKMIVAVLRARTVNDSEGIATPVQCLYDAFGIKAKAGGWRPEAVGLKPEACLTQCLGGSCPGGQCPAPAPYLLPYRYKEQYRNQQPAPSQPAAPSPAWPTLPIVQPGTVDLGPTNEKLDKIAALLIKQFQPTSPSAAQVPLPAPVDDAARKAADEAKTTAAEAKVQSDKVADKLGKIDSIFEKFGTDPETLIQKAIDRVNKVKTELGPNAEPDDVFKAYAKDLVKEKLKEGLAGAGGLSFDKLVSVGGGIPAVGLAIFGCVVVWKLVNNKPLAIEQIAPNSLAGKTTAELREHIAAAVEPIKSQIEAKFNQLTSVATDAKAAAEAAKAVSQVISAQSTMSTAGK